MKVFQDIFTNDEIMSDVFKFTLDYDDVIMKVPSRLTSPDNCTNIDVGCGNAFGGAEEDDGGADAGGEKVLDIEYNHNLAKTSFSKPEFMALVKPFLKNLKAKLVEQKKEDRVEKFMAGAQNFIKKVVSDFDAWEFYTGASESLEGSIVLAFWEDESASGPVFYLFNDALKEVKC